MRKVKNEKGKVKNPINFLKVKKVKKAEAVLKVKE